MTANDKPVAIVTAASRGIGRACVEELGRRGYQLVVLARSEGVEEMADRFGARAVRGSVTDVAALQSAVDCAVETFGRIDGVVSNTGHPARGPLLELSDQDWHEGLDLLVLGAIRLARLVTPIMQKQGGGSIVNISTFAAFEPSLQYPVSSALRAALTGFTRLFAHQFSRDNVRMNCVLPGFIDSHDVDAETTAAIPMGRPGSVHEIAKTVAFLLSDESSYTTGESLRVDGGLARSI